MKNEEAGSREIILVVDDEDVTRFMMDLELSRRGYAVVQAESGDKALKILRENTVDALITDQEMPGMNGLELLTRVKVEHPGIPVIVLTAHGSVSKAVASIKQGADDYLQKPCEPEELLAVLRRSLAFRRMRETNLRLRDHLLRLYSFHNIRTRSPRMEECLKLAEKVAKSSQTTVCILGESGTGKEVLARAIHFAGERMDEPFVAVNCAGIPAGLLESELFGHTKGAFTGADRDRPGRFAAAGNGSLLLDEIGDLPMDLQGKLLRVLQERVYERLGSSKPVRADFRIIVATHRSLSDMVKAGSFREDLFHRISAFPISLPPLRDRREDIPLLVEHFLEKLRDELGKPLSSLSSSAMEALLSYPWPGNIRELKNCLERAAIVVDGPVIRRRHLNIGRSSEKDSAASPGSDDVVHLEVSLDRDAFSLDAVIDRVLSLSLDRFDNNKSKAAAWLKVDRKMFYRR